MKIDKNKYFGHIQGYTIPGSHFELGSNLHINDYYYAKRLFYNSFYTNRFAFLAASILLKELSALLRQKLDTIALQNPVSQITLIGFENYSELLVSNIRKMLNDYIRIKYKLDDEIFNHDIYVKKGLFLKNPQKIAKEMVFIFPISTTFSSSIRIQNEIKEILAEPEFEILNPDFLNPVINCLIIANRQMNKNAILNEDDIEHQFGWRVISAKERKVEMVELNSDYSKDDPGLSDVENKKRQIIQKYLIALRTNWSRINNCASCYPENPTDEQCIIETKATPVTPNLIFGFPKSIIYESERNIFPIFNIRQPSHKSEPLVYRKHLKRYGAHFLYYIRTGRFLQENKVNVQSWLAEIREKELKDLLDRNVVIITPTNGSSSGFANLVNDLIFSDTATIIQYDPKEEFLQNFKIFYGDIVSQAYRIIFVDDVLSTTKTIADINFFIQNARGRREGLDYCLCLINRAGYFNYIKLDAKLRYNHEEMSRVSPILSYVDIHVPPITHRDKFPYDALTERFMELSSKSVLDSMRIHFKRRVRNFSAVNLTQGFDKFEKEGKPKALFQFLLLHELTKFFEYDHKNQRYLNAILIHKTFVDITPDSYNVLLEHFSSNENSLNSFIKYYPEFKKEVRNGLFKLCASDPFVQNKNIKEAVFKWVLYELIAIIEEINNNGGVPKDFFTALTDGIPSAFCPYQRLRFLLKRAAKLKMNYIYSIEVLTALSFIIRGLRKNQSIHFYKYTSKELFEGGEIEEDVHNKKPVYAIEFITYYVGLLQELIIEHEAKALGVVVNIKKIIDINLQVGGSGKSLRNSHNDPFIHLMRFLVLENTFIFHTCCERFLVKMKPIICFCSKDNSDFNRKLEHFEKTYPFNYTRYMLSRFDYSKGEVEYEPDTGIMDSFRHMLLLKAMLQNDLKETAVETSGFLRDKVEEILKECCTILGIKSGGAFFAVKYQNRYKNATEKDVAIIGEYAQDKTNSFKTDEITNNSVLYNVFDGITENEADVPLSTFEVNLDRKHIYRFRENNQISYDMLSTLSEFQGSKFRKFFYLRISEIEATNSGQEFKAYPQAVLCFYDYKLKQSDAMIVDEQFGKGPVVPVFQSINYQGQGNQAFERDELYLRFDPKRIRQLLLLRNDLNDFINHHFNNDSLRAYIEMINRSKYYVTMRHGTNVYESLVDEYIDRIRDAKNLDDAIEASKSLQTIFLYLTNKFHLMSITSKIFDHIGPQLSNLLTIHSVEQLVLEFTDNHKFVFMLNQYRIFNLPNERFFYLDTSAIGEQELSINFKLFNNMLKELVFEILYNIKKHAIHEYGRAISEKNKLIVTLTVEVIDSSHWFCVRNNFSKKDSIRISKQNENLARGKQSHGLNLIYNIIKKTSGLSMFMEGTETDFKIFIPLNLTNERLDEI